MIEKPNTTDKVIRFGCGFIFGLFVCMVPVILFFAGRDYSFVAYAALVALVFGVLSIRYGESFWRWMSRNWQIWLFWS